MAEKKAKAMSKSALFEAVTKEAGNALTKRQVKSVIETLASVAHKELKKNGVFVLPGFAKFVVAVKPGRAAGPRMDPFKREVREFPAKPASKTVRARPIKALKDAVV